MGQPVDLGVLDLGLDCVAFELELDLGLEEELVRDAVEEDRREGGGEGLRTVRRVGVYVGREAIAGQEESVLGAGGLVALRRYRVRTSDQDSQPDDQEPHESLLHGILPSV